MRLTTGQRALLSSPGVRHQVAVVRADREAPERQAEVAHLLFQALDAVEEILFGRHHLSISPTAFAASFFASCFLDAVPVRLMPLRVHVQTIVGMWLGPEDSNV